MDKERQKAFRDIARRMLNPFVAAEDGLSDTLETLARPRPSTFEKLAEPTVVIAFHPDMCRISVGGVPVEKADLNVLLSKKQ